MHKGMDAMDKYNTYCIHSRFAYQFLPTQNKTLDYRTCKQAKDIQSSEEDMNLYAIEKVHDIQVHLSTISMFDKVVTM